eukprot:CAMPEP_0119555372 /NCGR_PEP_ID=MMETSP1352-20130426/7611_1 /TAXON_ID=265584 /ORGANISM="Stauroneis constricta, Strain CCMP1120" /LENGTH=1335 /DNA_ID=CAMNT_0007602125 /DNA_START=426 /DNA_END=4433 /DNA_ORIENTATION=-
MAHQHSDADGQHQRRGLITEYVNPEPPTVELMLTSNDGNDQCKYSTFFNTTVNANSGKEPATGIFFGIRAKEDMTITSLQFPYTILPDVTTTPELTVELYSIDEFVIDDATSVDALSANPTLNDLSTNWKKHTGTVMVLNPTNERKGLISAVRLSGRNNQLNIPRGNRKTIYMQVYQSAAAATNDLQIFQLPQDNIHNAQTGSLWQFNDQMEVYVGMAAIASTDNTGNQGVEPAAANADNNNSNSNNRQLLRQRHPRHLEQVPDLKQMTLLPRVIFQGSVFTSQDGDCPTSNDQPLMTTIWAGQTFGVDANADLQQINQAVFDAISSTIFQNDVQLKSFVDSNHIVLRVGTVNSQYKATNNICDSAYQQFFTNGCQVVDVEIRFTHLPGLLTSRQLELEMVLAMTNNLELTQSRLRSNHGIVFVSDIRPLESRFTIVCNGVPSSTILNPIQRTYVQDSLMKYFDHIYDIRQSELRNDMEVNTIPRVFRVKIESQRTENRRRLRRLQVSETDRPTAVLQLETLLVGLGTNASQQAYIESMERAFQTYDQELFDQLSLGHHLPGPVNRGGTNFGDIFANLFRVSTSISRGDGSGGNGGIASSDDTPDASNSSGDSSGVTTNDIIIYVCSVVLGLSVIFLIYRFAKDYLLVGKDDQIERQNVRKGRRKSRRRKSSDRRSRSRGGNDDNKSVRSRSSYHDDNKSASTRMSGRRKSKDKFDDEHSASTSNKKKITETTAHSSSNASETASKATRSSPSSKKRKGKKSKSKSSSKTDDDKNDKKSKKNKKNKNAPEESSSANIPSSSSRPPATRRSSGTLKRSSSFSGEAGGESSAALPSWNEFVKGGKSGDKLFEDDNKGDSGDSKRRGKMRRSSSFDNFDLLSGGLSKPKRRPSLTSIASAPQGNQAGKNGRGIGRAKSMDDHFLESAGNQPRRGGRRDDASVSRNRSGQNGRGIGRAKSMDVDKLPRSSNSSSRGGGSSSGGDGGERRRGVGRAKSMDDDFFDRRRNDDNRSVSRNRAGEKGRGVKRSTSYDAERISSSASTSSGERRRGGVPRRSSSLMETPSARVNQFGKVDTINPDPKRGVSRSRSADGQSNSGHSRGLNRSQSVRSSQMNGQYNDDDNRSRGGRDDRSTSGRSRDDRSTSGRSRDGRGGNRKSDARSVSSRDKGRPPLSGSNSSQAGGKKGGRKKISSSHSTSGASVQSGRSKMSRMSTRSSVRQDDRTGRMVFEAKGRKIYEFEQTDKDITIFIGAPSFVKSTNELTCNISKTHLQLGLTGSSKWFIDEDTFSAVDSFKSSWSLGQEFGHNIIFVYLRKLNRGDYWETALHGKHKGSVRPVNR